MGNNPNRLIECGMADRDTIQEVESTREEAIKRNQAHGKNLFAQKANLSHQTPSRQLPILEHENLTKVSKTHQAGFTPIRGSMYEDTSGKGLDEIIESRYNTAMHFPEDQVVTLLECLAYSLAYLSSKAVPHHDFYPTNILYNQGQFRVRNPAALDYSSYSITLQRKRFSFLSPELIEQILANTPQTAIPRATYEKADVFSIGMILLQFCTLEPSAECYDPETYSLIQQTIRKRILHSSTIYNPKIAHCLDMMLQLNSQSRIPPIDLAYQVHSAVRSHRQSINQEMSRIRLPNNLGQPLPVRVVPGPDPNKFYPQLLNTPPLNTQLLNTPLLSNPLVNTPPQLMPVGPKRPPYQNSAKLNPFQLIRQDEQEDNESPAKVEARDANEGNSQATSDRETLDERVRRILEASRHMK